jgi:hypothetical protein
MLIFSYNIEKVSCLLYINIMIRWVIVVFDFDFYFSIPIMRPLQECRNLCSRIVSKNIFIGSMQVKI